MSFRIIVRFAVFLSGLGWAVATAADDKPVNVVVGQTFMANSEDPRTGSTPWALISHGIAEKLFTVNQNGDIIGQLAESVNRVDFEGRVWEVTLKSGSKFSDGTDVDAQHVTDSLNQMNAENDGAQASLGSIMATVSNNQRVRIESEMPTHAMDAVLAEWAFVIFYIDDDDNFVYTGPYAVDHFSEDDHIDLVPNEFYPKANERPDMIEVKKYPDGHTLAEEFVDGDDLIDVAFHLPIDTLPEIRNTDGLNARSFDVGYHYMMFYNTREPHLSDVRVRKAIDLVIDRDALSQALAGGHGTRSLFPKNSPYYSDESDSHGDKSGAEALLDEAGWMLTDGKRIKDGEELIIDLVAYPHRPGLVNMQPLIGQQLATIGITVRPKLTGDDWDETQTIIDNADFDILMWAQHTLPAGDPAWFLNSFFRTEGGNNHAGFTSSEVDSLLDTLSITEEHEARVLASANAHDKIVGLAPVSNLVTPDWHVGLTDRVADKYEPWGADYYVIRADTFLNVKALEDLGSGAATTTSALFLSPLLILVATVSLSQS